MVDEVKKVSDLPLAGPITGAEIVPIVQGGVTVQASVSEFIPEVIAPPVYWGSILGTINTQTDLVDRFNGKQDFSPILTSVSALTDMTNAIIIGEGAAVVVALEFQPNEFLGRDSTGGLTTHDISDLGFDFLEASTPAAARAVLEVPDTFLTNPLTVSNQMIVSGTGGALGAITLGVNTFPGRSSTGNVVNKPISNFGFSLVSQPDAPSARTLLGVTTGGGGGGESPEVLMTDYWVDGDGTNWSPALGRALAASKTVRIPDGNYSFSTPVNMVDGMRLMGYMPAGRTTTGGAICTAPSGFIHNPGTTRMSIHIANLHIKGTRTQGSASNTTKAIKGPFGGKIIACRIEDMDTLIENSSAYLTHYEYCSFDNALFGMNLADFNGCRIKDCWFSGVIRNHISIVDITPLSGGNTGTPMIIEGNNFNLSGTHFQNQSSCKLRGNIILNGNYWEDYGGSSESGSIMVDLTVSRHDKMGFTCYNNEFNGQGHALHAIRITSLQTDGIQTRVNADIARNRFIAFVGNAVQAGTANYLSNVRIADNNDTITVGGFDSRWVYRPMAHYYFPGTISAGSSDTTIPIRQTVVYDNMGGTTGSTDGMRLPKPGNYRLTGVVVMEQSAASPPMATIKMTLGGVAIRTVYTTLATGARQTVALDYLGPFIGTTSMIRLTAAGGGNVLSASLTAEFVGDGLS